ncbi:MAG: hypothetical protein U9N32_03905, partial [Spirochaetota bacterium]|nr:hypothetical protein [Spirochaetota bacterium]
MRKRKSLYLPDNKFIIFIPLFFTIFPLYSYELTNTDAIYFQTINNDNPDNLEIIDILTQSALSRNNAIRLQSALELSKKGLVLGEYELVSSVCKSLLDDGFTHAALLENLFESSYMQDDQERFIFIVNKYLLKDNVEFSQKIEYYSFISKLYENHESTTEYFRELLIKNNTSELTIDAYT